MGSLLFAVTGESRSGTEGVPVTRRASSRV